jgi:hypothetical protein
MTARLAASLRRAAAGLRAERVTVAGLLQAHGPTAHGSLLLLLAVPCLLPIPGTGTVLGFGVLAVAVALWRGQPDVALPRRVAELEMPRAWARRVLAMLVSLYALTARVATKRQWRWVPTLDRRWLATAVGTMAVLLILPIPFGNVLPALALVAIGLGLAFRDRALVLLGAVAAVLTAILTSGLLLAVIAWGMDGVAHVFS